jgi:hypothetical protein
VEHLIDENNSNHKPIEPIITENNTKTDPVNNITTENKPNKDPVNHITNENKPNTDPVKYIIIENKPKQKTHLYLEINRVYSNLIYYFKNHPVYPKKILVTYNKISNDLSHMFNLSLIWLEFFIDILNLFLGLLFGLAILFL